MIKNDAVKMLNQISDQLSTKVKMYNEIFFWWACCNVSMDYGGSDPDS